MRLKTLLQIVAAVLLLGLTAWATPAQDPQDQGSDDVAAAARRAKEQQKNAPKPKKVLTNDDFPAPASTPPAAQDTASQSKPEGQEDAAAPTDDKKTANEEDDPKGEKYWRKKFQELHDKLDHAEQELDVLQRELPKTETQYYSDPQTAMLQQHDRSDINNKTAQIDAKKKEVDSLKQQISDLEDDLRKAGGDPGWAR